MKSTEQYFSVLLIIGKCNSNNIMKPKAPTCTIIKNPFKTDQRNYYKKAQQDKASTDITSHYNLIILN